MNRSLKIRVALITLLLILLFPPWAAAVEQKRQGGSDAFAAAQLRPVPLQAAWTITAAREIPFINDRLLLTPAYLPLKNAYFEVRENGADSLNLGGAVVLDDAGSIIAGERLLGLITGEKGEVAEVIWTGEIIELAGGTTGLLLKFNDLGSVGKYEGKVALYEGDNGSGIVALTVNLTTYWLWPFLTIFLAIMLTMFVDRFRNSQRKIRLLNSALDNIMLDYRSDVNGRIQGQSQAFLDNIGSGKPTPPYTYDSYDINKDLRVQVIAMKGIAPHPRDGVTVLKLQESHPLNLPDDYAPYKALQAEAEALQASVAGWGDFGGQLAALDGAIVALKNDSQVDFPGWKPPGTSGNLPRFILEAETYLMGNPNLTVAQYRALPAKVAASAELAKTWRELVETLHTHRATINKIRLAPAYRDVELVQGPDYLALEQVQRELNEVYGALWEIGPAADMAAYTGDLMQEAERTLAALRIEYLSGPLFGKGALSAGFLNALGFTDPNLFASWLSQVSGAASWSLLFRPVVEASATAGPVSESEIADRYRARTHFYDWLIVIMTGALALIAGMELKVIGKNFGTPWDFLVLLAIGLTGAVALDALAKSLGSYLSTSKRA